MVLPGLWCTEGDPTNALGDPQRERAPCNRLRGLPERLQPPFTERQSDGASSSTEDALRALVATLLPPAIPLPTHPSARPSSNKPGGKHNHIHSCSETPELRDTQACDDHLSP